MGKMKDVATTAQWIGEAAANGEQAYRAGDYDLLKACLACIQDYANDLGYVRVPVEEDNDDPVS